ncbi:MAG: FAD-dependent oxidoreductase [Leptolyngbyaceae cyanobacterium bins.302]|nr:FAD-dependent oxidoreductase [Leptolyngbyaceae cyanobacterium bins.302]
MPATQPPVRSYDIIGFGDEVPGILALISAAREFYRLHDRYPRTLLMFKGNSQQGVGGHLVRGGLSYLDRSSIPQDIRKSLGLPTFGDPAAIYEEFLETAGVLEIGLDPRQADKALREMLRKAQVSLLSNIEIDAVLSDRTTITGIRLTNGDTYLAKQFIDATVNAELAQCAGVPKLKGFGVMGLPDSELSVTLTFETEGLSLDTLKRHEWQYLQRFTDLQDSEAQHWIDIAAAGNPALADQLRRDLRDRNGNLKPMYVGRDYIDVRCKALSIAYHAFRGTALSLQESGAILDNGNVARFSDGRLSWNALLFDVNADQAEALARGKAKPTPAMLREMAQVETWFRSLGATRVRPALELYIRHAGNVMEVNDPLSGSEMLAGGVPANEAFGTFGYHFDVRGGIAGLGDRASARGIGNVVPLKAPLFNVGMQHALVKSMRNLAIISPASGFDGYACSAGRIVEFNCAVGQGVGIAAAIALSQGRNLADISNLEVRRVLHQTGKLSRIYGRSNPIEAAQLDDFENRIAA